MFAHQPFLHQLGVGVFVAVKGIGFQRRIFRQDGEARSFR